jgi:hypothetical protein
MGMSEKMTVPCLPVLARKHQGGGRDTGRPLGTDGQIASAGLETTGCQQGGQDDINLLGLMALG